MASIPNPGGCIALFFITVRPRGLYSNIECDGTMILDATCTYLGSSTGELQHETIALRIRVKA
jgi:hypothetical protein